MGENGTFFESPKSARSTEMPWARHVARPQSATSNILKFGLHLATVGCWDVWQLNVGEVKGIPVALEDLQEGILRSLSHPKQDDEDRHNQQLEDTVRCRSICRMTQLPLLTPVMEEVVSNPQVLMLSATF